MEVRSAEESTLKPFKSLPRKMRRATISRSIATFSTVAARCAGSARRLHLASPRPTVLHKVDDAMSPGAQ